MLLILTNLETNKTIEFSAFSERDFEEYYLELFDYEYLEKYEGDFDDLIKLELEIEGANYLIPQSAFEPGNFFLMLVEIANDKSHGELWRWLYETFTVEEIISMYDDIEDITWYEKSIEEIIDDLVINHEIDREKYELFTSNELTNQILNYGNYNDRYFEFEDGVIVWTNGRGKI